MGNSISQGCEIDLSSAVCTYERSAGVVVVHCRECPGEGILSNHRCRAGCIRALAGEKGCSEMVLAEYNETMYTHDAVEVLQTISKLLRELDTFCEEKHEMRNLHGVRCDGCVLNPRKLYPGLRRTLFMDIGDFYNKTREALLKPDPEDKKCSECSSGVKDRLFLLLYMLEETRKLILTRGMGVVLEQDENTGAKGPRMIRQTSSKGLLSSAENVETASLQKGLEKVLQNHRKIRPCFSNAWLDPSNPPGGILVGGRKKDGARTRLFQLLGREESFYHVLPEEYLFDREDVKIIEDMRRSLLIQDASALMLDDINSIRSYIEDAARRGLTSLLQHRRKLSRLEAAERAGSLSQILARYTAGMGVLEYVMGDNMVQDIYIDAPSSHNPTHLTAGVSDHRLIGKMVTNMVLDAREMDTMVSRLRHMSGLPFSEANPILETDMEEYNTRATVIGPPLSPQGIAVALRRHSAEPWTLPRLTACSSMPPMAAGLLWYLVDGQATFIIAGSRGSGKSSLLGSMLFALPRSQRMLVIEDTMELPVSKLQSLGYKAQSLNISGAGGRDALKVSLRLGEGALILGEVRGEDARLLYEAMRTGTAGSTVMGTFHADSPKSVYERVVHDLKIPFQSFSATDVVVIAGLVRPGGGSRVKRRVTHIAEVNKENEGGFRSLMLYDEESDKLSPTDDFYYRSEVISGIARSWGMSMEAAIREIENRANVVESLVTGGEQFTSAAWASKAFEKFKDIKEKNGQKVQEEWRAWFLEAGRYE